MQHLCIELQYQKLFISYHNQMSLFHDFTLQFIRLHIVLNSSFYAKIPDL